jgi:hypothetical protein
LATARKNKKNAMVGTMAAPALAALKNAHKSPSTVQAPYPPNILRHSFQVPHSLCRGSGPPRVRCIFVLARVHYISEPGVTAFTSHYPSSIISSPPGDLPGTHELLCSSYETRTAATMDSCG